MKITTYYATEKKSHKFQKKHYNNVCLKSPPIIILYNLKFNIRKQTIIKTYKPIIIINFIYCYSRNIVGYRETYYYVVYYYNLKFYMKI